MHIPLLKCDGQDENESNQVYRDKRTASVKSAKSASNVYFCLLFLK